MVYVAIDEARQGHGLGVVAACVAAAMLVLGMIGLSFSSLGARLRAGLLFASGAVRLVFGALVFVSLRFSTTPVATALLGVVCVGCGAVMFEARSAVRSGEARLVRMDLRTCALIALMFVLLGWGLYRVGKQASAHRSRQERGAH